MFGDIIQPTHLLFILVVALIVLGPKRLPEVGRSLGKGLRDFRSAMSGIEEHANGLLHDDPPPASPPPPVADTAVEPQPAPAVVHTAVEPQSAPAVVHTEVEPQPAPAFTVPAAEPRAVATGVPEPQAVATGLPEPEPGDYAD